MAKLLASRALRKHKRETRLSLPSLVVEQHPNDKLLCQPKAADKDLRKSYSDTLKLPNISTQHQSYSDPVQRKHLFIRYDSEPLTISSLVSELCELSHKWKLLALKLGTTKETIKKIEEENPVYPDRCLITVLTYWFRKTPSRSWQKIIDVLNSSEISEPGIATRIMREYC